MRLERNRRGTVAPHVRSQRRGMLRIRGSLAHGKQPSRAIFAPNHAFSAEWAALPYGRNRANGWLLDFPRKNRRKILDQLAAEGGVTSRQTSHYAAVGADRGRFDASRRADHQNAFKKIETAGGVTWWDFRRAIFQYRIPTVQHCE